MIPSAFRIDCLIVEPMTVIGQIPSVNDQSAMYVLIGGAVFLLIYLFIRPQMRRKKDPLSRPLPQRLSQQRDVERQMESLLVELSEMSRQMSAQLDTRATKLELLIKDADERIAVLKRMEITPSPFKIDQESSRPTGAALMTAVDRAIDHVGRSSASGTSASIADVPVDDALRNLINSSEVNDKHRAESGDVTPLIDGVSTGEAENRPSELPANIAPPSGSGVDRSPGDRTEAVVMRRTAEITTGSPHSVAAAAPTVSHEMDPEHEAIYTLADTGRSIAQIATQLSRPSGEIELILALRPR